MAVLKKISSWLKYSSVGNHLSTYERLTMSVSGDTKCPRCKQPSMVEGDSERHYMASFYYCDTCGFSFTDQVLPFAHINQGIQLKLIDNQKARALKIQKIQKNQKINENRRNRFKIFR